MPRSPFLSVFDARPETIPIFPLLGAVVVPGVPLPLNVFEPGYLNMVADALGRYHLIGMIQPVGETSLDEVPRLQRLGRGAHITSHSETTDGWIMMVLTGVSRFQVRAELAGRRGYWQVAAD